MDSNKESNDKEQVPSLEELLEENRQLKEEIDYLSTQLEKAQACVYCFTKGRECALCEEEFCKDHLEKCEICDKKVCSDCYQQCRTKGIAEITSK